jgi:Uncharacterised nucleotidyltransferase
MPGRARPEADLPPAFALAAACAIWPNSERRIAAVRAAADAIDDWDRFLRVVARHRIQGLAHDGIVAAGVAAPPRIRESLRANAQSLARQSVAMAVEAVRLRCGFDKAGIPVAFVKGTTLAMLAYGSLGLRHSKDIDLLVPEECATEAVGTLERSGYVRIAPPAGASDGQLRLWRRYCKTFVFANRQTGAQIELHWRLSDNPLLAPAPAPRTWREVPVSSSASLPTLADGDLFEYLCIHGAYHAWFRLKWLADIGALMARSAASAEAKANETPRPQVQAMLLARLLLGTTIPPRVAADTRLVSRLMVRLGLAAMTRGAAETEPQDLVLGDTLINASRYLFCKGRVRFAQLRRDLVCEDDFQLLPLPERLSFAYPLVRLPLWMWRRTRHGGRSAVRARALR